MDKTAIFTVYMQNSLVPLLTEPKIIHVLKILTLMCGSLTLLQKEKDLTSLAGWKP